MENKSSSYVNAASAILLLAVTVYGWLNLPDQIAIHFGASGQTDGFAGKTLGLLLIPALYTGLYILFRYLPRIDPLGENIREFKKQYRTIMAAVLGLTSYVQVLIVFWDLEYSFSILQALAPAIAALYYITSHVIGEARQNWFIGIRNPWTLSDEEVWNRTHEKAAPMFKVAALIALIGAVRPDYFIAAVVAPVLAVALFTTAYSFWLYTRK